MAEKKCKFPTIFVLVTFVFIFYSKSWQESKKFVVPVPVTFRVANSPNLPMQKMDMTISKDFRHIDVTNISTDGTTLFEPNFPNKNGNEKTTAPLKLVSHISIPVRDTHSSHLIGEKTKLISSKDVGNIGVQNMLVSATNKPKWNENGNIETSLDVTYRLRSSEGSQKLVTHVPVPDRASHLTNSTDKNKNNIGVRNKPTNRTTADESKFNESGNSKVSFNDTCKIHECPSKKPCIKQIQLWASFRFREFPEKEYNCPEENCKARFVHSNSYDKLKTSHAVILHHKGSWKWEDLAR